MNDGIRVAAVQFCPYPPGHLDDNVEYVCQRMTELAQQGCNLVAFPELSLSNYPSEDRADVASVKMDYWTTSTDTADGRTIQRVASCAREVGVYAVVGLAERGLTGTIYNAALLIGPEGIVGVTRKAHLPGLEKLYFSPGRDIPVFITPIATIGLAVCYDAWHPEYVRVLALKGAEVVVNINSVWKGGAEGGIGNPQSKRRHWEMLPAMRAFENQVYMVAVNGCGTHFMGERYGQWERLGLSRIIDPHGAVLSVAPEDKETVLTAELSSEELLRGRSAYPFFADRRPELFTAVSLSGDRRGECVT